MDYSEESLRLFLKRDYDRLSYLYAKANTVSKKNRLYLDLVNFMIIYNTLVSEDEIFPWSNDSMMLDWHVNYINSFINNLSKEYGLISEIIEKSFDVFLEADVPVYDYYGKYYHKMSDTDFQKHIFSFLKTFDNDLVERFNGYLINNGIFAVGDLGRDYSGLFCPVNSIDKNVIFFKNFGYRSVVDACILAHELGHEFEFNVLKDANVKACLNNSSSIYVEVISNFFEYAFVNYLIDNRIYLDCARKYKINFLYGMFLFISRAMVLFSMKAKTIDTGFSCKIDSEYFGENSWEVIEKANSYDDVLEAGCELNFKHSYIYSYGKIMAVCMYELYKENPTEFMKNLKATIMETEDLGFKAFERLGITEEEMVSGNLLKRALKKI